MPRFSTSLGIRVLASSKTSLGTEPCFLAILAEVMVKILLPAKVTRLQFDVLNFAFRRTFEGVCKNLDFVDV